MSQKKVLAVIVSFNGEQWIEACIHTLQLNNYENLEIIVVDNASIDNTVAIVENRFKNVIILKQNRNVGFGRGANIGIKYACTHNFDYLLLLNQDVKLAPDCIKNLFDTFQQETHRVGIICPMQMTYDGSDIDPNFKKLLISNNIPSKIDRLLKQSYEIDAIIGACAMFSMSLFRAIGFFDPLYFLYHEEQDLCRRARYHSFNIRFAPVAKVFHWHTLLHPHRMSFKVKISSLYGYYFYILKNPFMTTGQNIIYLLEEMVKWIFREENIFKTTKRFFVNLAIAFFIFLNIPRLLKNRKADMKGSVIV